MKKILVINGPNLNFLGIREKGVYGNENYEDLLKYISAKFENADLELFFFQSNHEGTIIDKLQESYYSKLDGIVINPGAYTHYSYAIYDAIKSIMIPTIEVHISNIHEREEFRKKSVITPACIEQIAGMGKEGYVLAIEKILKYLSESEIRK